MQTFDFTLTIDQFVEDLDVVDTFYSRLDDVSMFNADSTTRITFHRDATTLDEALRSAVSDLRSLGYKVMHIEVEPECVGV